MKFTRKIVENVFKNLCKTPKSIHEFNDGTSFDVDLENDWGDSLRVVVSESGCVEFTTGLDYRGTFDKDDIKFFDSIDVTSWEIYKHWIKFNVKATNEKELEAVTRKVIDRYYDYD